MFKLHLLFTEIQAQRFNLETTQAKLTYNKVTRYGIKSYYANIFHLCHL